MQFNSFIFILLFLPVTVFLYFIANRSGGVEAASSSLSAPVSSFMRMQTSRFSPRWGLVSF